MKTADKLTYYWFFGSLIYLHFCYEMFPQADIIYILILPFVTCLIVMINADGLSNYLKDKEKYQLFIIAIVGSATFAAALPIFYFILETIILVFIGFFR